MEKQPPMADSDAATHQENDWPTPGMRQRLGSRIERHVLRSAVDMLDDRGSELDSIERKLVEREQHLAERLSAADAERGRARPIASVGSRRSARPTWTPPGGSTI